MSYDICRKCQATGTEDLTGEKCDTCDGTGFISTDFNVQKIVIVHLDFKTADFDAIERIVDNQMRIINDKN